MVSNYTLADVFKHQRELMRDFNAIEARNGLLKHAQIPIDLETKSGQSRARELAWRIVEEISEALDAFEKKSRDEFYEELADVFHFIVEFCIACGVDEPRVSYYLRDLDMPPLIVNVGLKWLNLIRLLGFTINGLKNKPWSFNERLLSETDLSIYQARIVAIVGGFIQLCAKYGITLETLISEFQKKAAINEERIKASHTERGSATIPPNLA